MTEKTKKQRAVQDYFAKRAKCYEEVYSNKRIRGLRSAIYRLGWFPLRLIFRYTMKYLAGAKPRKVLDIGCGTGMYSAELAGRGVDVTGLDSCREMIKATENLVERSILSGRVQTIFGDFLDWSRGAGEEYDLALAIGIMDCVHDAGAYLLSFRRVAREVIVTFPARYIFSFVAAFSYHQHGIDAHFYTQEEIKDLFHAAGLEIVHFTRLFPSTYWVHATKV